MVQLSVRYERLKHNIHFRDNSVKQVPAPPAARCETITRDYIVYTYAYMACAADCFYSRRKGEKKIYGTVF